MARETSEKTGEGDFVLGIDGGGTVSTAVAVDFEGHVLARARGGPLNFYTTSAYAFRSNLAELTADVLGMIVRGRRRHTTVGTGALLEGANREERILAFGEGADAPETTLVGDAVTAVYGAALGNPGLLVISGTGSIAAAVNRAGEIRCAGGYGPLIGGDPGSAFWMAGQAVLAAERNRQARGTLCPLGKAICDYFEVTHLPDLIPLLYGEEFVSHRLAGLSAHLAGGPGEDLSGWRSIEEEAGRSLAELAAVLWNFPEESGATVFGSGSVFVKNARVRGSFCRSLGQRVGCEDITAMPPALDAAAGAALLALRQAGCGNLERAAAAMIHSHPTT